MILTAMQVTDRTCRLLDTIDGGADIYDYGMAMKLRLLERRGLVRCVDAHEPPRDGAECQPYFGAIPSRKGKAMIAERNRRKERCRDTH
jgi:hypothetical protein